MPTLQITLPDGGKSSHELAEETVTVGRLADNNVQIDDISVSSHHAVLTLSGGDYHLKDLNSTNGTRVNGQPVTEKSLHSGDKVRFGKIDVLYQSDIHHPDEKRELPAAEAVILAPASTSSRPADFGSTAPFAIKKEKADGGGKAAMAAAIVAILAFLGAVAYIVTQQPSL